jgi:hypothetical protein
MEDIAADDWHDQLVGTVARAKALSGYSKDEQMSSSRLPRPQQVRIQKRHLRISKRQILTKHGIRTYQMMLQQNAWQIMRRKMMVQNRQILVDRKSQ